MSVDCTTHGRSFIQAGHELLVRVGQARRKLSAAYAQGVSLARRKYVCDDDLVCVHERQCELIHQGARARCR